jgi:hypothetical protein
MEKFSHLLVNIDNHLVYQFLLFSDQDLGVLRQFLKNQKLISLKHSFIVLPIISDVSETGKAEATFRNN